MESSGRRVPPEEKARATRRRILVEATRLFARQGYHKTTVADIADAIGMTQGALFHHFANKEAVLEAVVDGLARGMDQYRDAMERADPRASVRRVIDHMVDHYRRQPEATVCLAALATEFAGTGHPVLERILEAYERFVEPFAAVLAADAGVEDPRAAAIAFIGSVQGIAVQGLLRGGEPPLERLARAFAGLLGPMR
ncbi:MAG: hypothetical protein Kow0092_34240 [Deferrisomatales bacterium]